jgi:hypothetical protein
LRRFGASSTVVDAGQPYRIGFQGKVYFDEEQASRANAVFSPSAPSSATRNGTHLAPSARRTAR